ncbi:MAG: THUMP domain-containing protein [Candidatus Helarchaeota archaeon]
MQENFNLLISCPRFHEKDAIAELWYLYSNIGDDEVRSEYSTFPGLIIAKTNIDPIISIQKLKKIIVEDPSLLRFVLKIIPIEIVIETNLEKILEVTNKLKDRINELETFRITVKNRFSPFDSQDLIIKVAEHIDRKVNLTKPDKILMIQILGKITGLALLKPADILTKAEFSH